MGGAKLLGGQVLVTTGTLGGPDGKVQAGPQGDEHVVQLEVTPTAIQKEPPAPPQPAAPLGYVT